MSADNWTECPRCDERHAGVEIQMKKQLSEVYGDVTAERYDELKEALAAHQREILPDTLREDYGFQFNGTSGELGMYYGCRCTEDGCGFKFEYKNTVPVDTRA